MAALFASGRNAPVLPTGWISGEILALTPADDFLGGRALLAELAAALRPWSIRPLPIESARPVASDEHTHEAEALAAAAVKQAAHGARVLVLTARQPWDDPVGRAIIRSRLAEHACAADQTAACHARAGFALQAIDSAESMRFVAQTALDKLEAIMVRLLAPGGCPWDREQTHASLRPYVVEEAAEVIEAIERGTPGKLVDELGDLLLQIAFHSALAAEAGDFTLADVAGAIEGKMLYRHPHVFSDWQVKDSEDVLRNWDALKANEIAATGGEGDPGPWRLLRKAAVRASLASLDVAFAAARGSEEAFEAARRDLYAQIAALLAEAREAFA